MIVRPADHDVTAEVRIPETQRNPNPGLGLGDAGRETEQHSDDDEHAFHGCLLGHALTEEACQTLDFSKCCNCKEIGSATRDANVRALIQPVLVQSPKLMPRSRAVVIVSESSGTRRGVAITSASGTATIRGGCKATIIPN